MIAVKAIQQMIDIRVYSCRKVLAIQVAKYLASWNVLQKDKIKKYIEMT